MMTSNLHAAVSASGRDSGVPWHYGDPLREQRLMITGATVVDRSNRDVLQVAGDDRLGWLHSICSQHVSALADGDSTEALVLSPHGHVEQHWQVTELDGRVWLDTEPGAAPEVLGYLQKMRFLKRVEPVDVSGEWAVLTVVGPATATVLALAAIPIAAIPVAAIPVAAMPVAAIPVAAIPVAAIRVVGAAGHAVALPDGGLARRMSWPGVDAVDLIVPRSDRVRVIDSLVAAGAHPAGQWAFDALRVEARRPRLGLETDHRTIPHEVGWIGPAVHLDKGCYRGQETVARVQNLGRPPRRLTLLHLSGESDELPEPGTPVEFGGRTVGFLGTAVHHHELGPVALAVIKRTLPATTQVTVGGFTALADDGA